MISKLFLLELKKERYPSVTWRMAKWNQTVESVT